jgi:hypothetical protein
MNNWYQIYQKEVEDLLQKFHADFEASLERARDKDRVYYSCLNDYLDRHFSSSRLMENVGYYEKFLDTVDQIYSLDHNLTESDAFIKAHEEARIELSKKNIKMLARTQALSLFIDKLKDLIKTKEKHVATQTEEIQKTNRYWLGSEGTEFVQLIYALIEAGRLPERGKTKMVKEMANFFGIELSGNWQSNLSSSIHERKNGYAPGIFEELRKGWERYEKRQLGLTNLE